MPHTGDRATGTQPAQVRLDRPVLVGNLVSGVVCLSPLAVISWPLFVIGAAYVVVGGVFLAAVYGRTPLTRWQEGWAWVAPWLAAVALWTFILTEPDDVTTGSLSGSLFGLYGGMLVGTLLYLIWQTAALAVRQFMSWRSGASPPR